MLPAPEGDPRVEAAGSMAAQRDHMVTCATGDEDRLRSVLLESRPALEALADLSDLHWLSMLASLGGPWGILDAGRASPRCHPRSLFTLLYGKSPKHTVRTHTLSKQFQITA